MPSSEWVTAKRNNSLLTYKSRYTVVIILGQDDGGGGGGGGGGGSSSSSSSSSNNSSSSKGKAIPLQACTGPEGSRRLRFPDFKTLSTCRW